MKKEENRKPDKDEVKVTIEINGEQFIGYGANIEVATGIAKQIYKLSKEC